ncbi:amino acid synthesis family protein [Sulfobacillus harzensis]|nr:amino acid synthesis family protein [Sulfobacillus harzensis]
MEPEIRKWYLVKETVESAMGRADNGQPLVKVASAVVIKNPVAGRYVEDLSPMVEMSGILGPKLVGRLAEAVTEPIESYGKAVLIGTNGDQEQGVALITTVFGNLFREQVGGGKAWISSMTKVVPTGASIDVPLAHKDALYVRSHYDGMTLTFPDAPYPDELVMIAVVATRGRINARLGGPKASEITGVDGLS